MASIGALAELDCWIDNLVKDAGIKLELEPTEIQLALLGKVQQMMIVSLTHSGKWAEFERLQGRLVYEKSQPGSP